MRGRKDMKSKSGGGVAGRLNDSTPCIHVQLAPPRGKRGGGGGLRCRGSRQVMSHDQLGSLGHESRASMHVLCLLSQGGKRGGGGEGGGEGRLRCRGSRQVMPPDQFGSLGQHVQGQHACPVLAPPWGKEERGGGVEMQRPQTDNVT